MDQVVQLIVGAGTSDAELRALHDQLRSREENLRALVAAPGAVGEAFDALDAERHALGLLHVLAARLRCLEASGDDAAARSRVLPLARRAEAWAARAARAQLEVAPKLAASAGHRLAALACREGGAAAAVAAEALASLAAKLAPEPACLTAAHGDCLQCCVAARRYGRGARFLEDAPVFRVAAFPRKSGAAAPPPTPPPGDGPDAGGGGFPADALADAAPGPRAARGSPASGLAAAGVQAVDLLKYAYYGGVVCCGLGRWRDAAELFAVGATAPAVSLSAVAIACLKKLVLCRLLARRGDPGDAGNLPKYCSSVVSRASKSLAAPYHDLAEAMAGGDFCALDAALNKHAEALARDGNAELAARLPDALRRAKAVELTHTYLNLPLADVAARAGLADADAAEALLLNMAKRQELRVAIDDAARVAHFSEEEGPGAASEEAIAATLHGEMAAALKLGAIVDKMAEKISLNPTFILKSANDLGDAPGAIRDADDANVASMDFM